VSQADYGPALGVLRDTIPQSFQSWFSFLLGRTQQKTNQMRAQDSVAKIPACSRLPIRPQKANSPSYTCQQWHFCRRVCDRQSNSYRPGLFKFFGRDHISYCTTLRGPDTLPNVTFSGYATFYQSNTFFVNIFFHYWQNMFCGRMKWLRRLDLARRP